MFKLQRLEITGFKSFAEHTEIVFTGNGITAVVGPNGCGKSNVSDAISWVLGEQRPKTLRGGEMKDVVFQGTKNRKPSGMAEVVLHLVRDETFFDIDEDELEDIDETLSEIDDHTVDIDTLQAETQDDAAEVVQANGSEIRILENGHFTEEEFVEVEKVQALQVGSIKTVEKVVKIKRHWRPRSFALDFAPGEAVSVTRRLYLSGESEYQLNGRTCRLRDIQDLFAGTGLSGAHYAIIEQGRIGQILSAKPADRRNLIEEAAGISKFRTRQRAAEARLESAKTNLGRISDIVSEIEKQANSLRRQAAKTRRYKILQEDFRVLLRQLFVAEGQHFSCLVEELEHERTEAAEIERSFAAKVVEKEEEFREATQNARKTEEDLSELRRQHSENALERDRAEREHRYRAEQVVNLNSRSEALRVEITSSEERLNLLKGERQRLAEDEEKETAESGKAEIALREAEQIYETRVSELQSIETKMDTERTNLLQHTAALERFTEIGRQLQNNLTRMRERADGLRREAIRAEEAYAEHKTEADSLAENVSAETLKLDSFNAEKQEIIAQTIDARNALRESEAALAALRNEFAQKKHRHETLLELEEKRAVYTPDVQKLFAEQEEIGVKLIGVLADKLNVDQKSEKAVKSLFGNYLQSIIVNTRADAEKILQWLRNNGVGRTAILIVPSAVCETENSSFANYGNTIADKLGISNELINILREIFPREMSARVVENFENAANGSEILVNFAGDVLIGQNLLLTGGQSSGDANESLLVFKRELNDLEKATVELSDRIERAENEVEQARVRLVEKEEKTVDLQSLIIKVERHLLTLEMQGRSIKQEIERAERHQKVVAEELKQTDGEIRELEQRRAEAAVNAEAADTERIQTENRLEKISQELNGARSHADADNAVLNEKRTLSATSNERRRSAASALRRVENEAKEIESRLGLQNLEIAESGTKIKDLRLSIAQIADKLALVETDKSREQEELIDLISMLKDGREKADAMSADLAETNRQSAEALNKRAEIEIRETEAATHLKNLNENCLHELNVPLAQLAKSETLPEDFELDGARELSEDLRQRVENFGAINMLALEELGEAEERLLFLTVQRQDIIDSIAAAEEALREIKTRSREKFKKAFEAINENFMVFFRELFGGGRGEMTLLEADDILEAGIEVVAQPPGKRLQNILLLSGGEKAMTAIALVLAIFKYHPSPFCLLDEVDAPLDDANVGRFVTKIADMAERTQFIVITHNKRTMEAARALYGVTMQEAGVSKIVSVKFE